MATNKKLKTALLAKLDITPQALSQRINTKKRQHPMTTEEAAYVIAHEEGLKLDKYLDQDTVARIRTLIHGTAPSLVREVRTKGLTRQSNVPSEIRFPNEFKTTDPIVPKEKLNHAKRMAQVYPLLYVMENSLREIIKRVMVAAYGEEWWDTEMTKGKLLTVKNNAENRKRKEQALSWHQVRGEHDIDYVDLSDLETIISAKQSHFFPRIISPDREWFTQFMRELIPSRNVVCHMNPLIELNINDLRIKVQRWNKMIQKNINNIPVHVAPSINKT